MLGTILLNFKITNMMLFKIQLTVAFVLVQLWQCNGEDIQYVQKVVSATKRDGFATSLATSHQRLVISAPKGKLHSR